MLTGRDIICISAIDWDFIWQGHQQIMARLAEAGNRVLYVENTGVRAPRLRDLPRLRNRLRNWSRGVKGFRRERENLFVYSPLVLPLPYSRTARVVNRTLLLRSLDRWMRSVGAARPIVWTFLPTQLVLDLVHRLEPALTVYYCIDDLPSSSRAARRVAHSEAQLFRDADLVFATATRLKERALRYRAHAEIFPFGVAYEEFEQIRKGPDEPPGELAGLPRPIVGYVGGLHQWIDHRLLAGVADRLPDVTFALIGPVQADMGDLTTRPNVHMLGVRAHAELPRYIKAFDVGIVPYRLTEYTRHVYPTKLNEYLAMGIPVVATELPEITRFNVENDHIVEVVPNDADRFASAVRRAVHDVARERFERRIDVARSNSWDARIAKMSELMEEALRRRERDREAWQPMLRQMYRRARRRLAVAAVGMATLYALVFHTPALWALGIPLRIEGAARPSGAIVVFGGGVGESGQAGGGYQERLQRAIELYQAGMAPLIVISSGFRYTFPEAEVMRSVAMSHGVPADAIVLETAAANTADNVRNVRPILEARSVRDVLLVSSPYHMRRAILTWRRLAPGITVVPTPVKGSQFYLRRGAAPSLEQVGGLVHEYLAIVAYWFRRWL